MSGYNSRDSRRTLSISIATFYSHITIYLGSSHRQLPSQHYYSIQIRWQAGQYECLPVWSMLSRGPYRGCSTWTFRRVNFLHLTLCKRILNGRLVLALVCAGEIVIVFGKFSTDFQVQMFPFYKYLKNPSRLELRVSSKQLFFTPKYTWASYLQLVEEAN